MHIFHDPEVDLFGRDAFGLAFVVHFDLVLRVSVLLGVEQGTVPTRTGRHLTHQLKINGSFLERSIRWVSFILFKTYLVGGRLSQDAFVALSDDGRRVSGRELLGRQSGQDLFSVPSNGRRGAAMARRVSYYIAPPILQKFSYLQGKNN